LTVKVPAAAAATTQVAVAEFPEPERAVDPVLVQLGEPGPVSVQDTTPAGVAPLAGPVTVRVKVADPPRDGDAGLLRLIAGSAWATFWVTAAEDDAKLVVPEYVARIGWATAVLYAGGVQVATPEPLSAWEPHPVMVVPLSVNATVPLVTAEAPEVTVAV
jgi:hypothetical protein